MEVLSDADDSSNTGRLPAHYIDSCCESISSFPPVFPSQQTVLSACAQLHLGIRIREADRIEVPILDRWVTSDVTMEILDMSRMKYFKITPGQSRLDSSKNPRGRVGGSKYLFT